ncbi:MAG: RIP metalloprotease RseP [Betaproteobacteria bacterium]|nr:RIP metalloprotease RseP [Betaproteobacteria bacterium]
MLLTVLYSFLGFIITIGILVTLHELGHYSVARWCNVKVLRFSFGFGPVLFSRRLGRDQTEWALSAIPLGGYVRMLDEGDRQDDEGPIAESDLPRAFNRQRVWKRFAIVAAGPLSNFLLAVLLLAAMFMVGVPGLAPVLSQPAAETAAAEAGLQPQDRIVAVDDQPVVVWQDVIQKLLSADASAAVTLTVERDGFSLKVPLKLSAMAESSRKGDSERSPAEQLGLHPYLGAPLLANVTKDSPASAAGLKKGDRVQAVNGVALDSPGALVEQINQTLKQTADQITAATAELTVRRDGMTLTIPVTPRLETDANGKKVARIGVTIGVDPEVNARYRVTQRYGVIESLGRGVVRTWDLTALSFKMIGRMIVGTASLKNLSGPITIADYAGQSIQAGFQQFMTYLALISIGLGVLNFLPVPLLDGGHLLYYFAEMLRGRPLPERVMEIGQRIGFALIVSLIVLALFNDFSRKF